MPVFYMEFDHVFIFSETQQATTVLILYILKYFGILSYSELLITFDDSCQRRKFQFRIKVMNY